MLEFEWLRILFELASGAYPFVSVSTFFNSFLTRLFCFRFRKLLGEESASDDFLLPLKIPFLLHNRP
jgi:hypothetical protein